MISLKLIRVAPGLYRNESGSIHVRHEDWDRLRSDISWVVTYEGSFGNKIRRRFRTLADARRYVESDQVEFP